MIFNNIFNSDVKKVPTWIMRQAGRYLPEYLQLREKERDFLKFCFNPDLVTEATLQPIKRFDMDAAIIFSDILVIPYFLGMKVEFKDKIGPILEPIDLNKEFIIDENRFKEAGKIYEAIRNVKNSLNDKTLIGFSGSPWTLACYMVEGKLDKSFSKIKKLAFSNSKSFQNLIDKLVEVVTLHLTNQINNGCDVVKLFDSWAGVLNEENYYRYVVEPNKRILENLPKNNLKILFAKDSAVYYKNLALKAKPDILAIDSNIDLDYINKNIPKDIIIQGNLDPIYLEIDDKSAIKRKTIEILENFRDRKHIFNLGHGIRPFAKIENLEYVVNIVREYKF